MHNCLLEMPFLHKVEFCTAFTIPPFLCKLECQVWKVSKENILNSHLDVSVSFWLLPQFLRLLFKMARLVSSPELKKRLPCQRGAFLIEFRI